MFGKIKVLSIITIGLWFAVGEAKAQQALTKMRVSGCVKNPVGGGEPGNCAELSDLRFFEPSNVNYPSFAQKAVETCRTVWRQNGEKRDHATLAKACSAGCKQFMEEVFKSKGITGKPDEFCEEPKSDVFIKPKA